MWKANRRTITQHGRTLQSYTPIGNASSRPMSQPIRLMGGARFYTTGDSSKKKPGRMKPPTRIIVTPNFQEVMQEAQLPEMLATLIGETNWKIMLACTSDYASSRNPLGSHLGGAAVQAYNGSSKIVDGKLVGREASHVGAGTMYNADNTAKSRKFYDRFKLLLPPKGIKIASMNERLAAFPNTYLLLRMLMAHDGRTVLAPAMVNRVMGLFEKSFIKSMNEVLHHKECRDPKDLIDHMVIESSKGTDHAIRLLRKYFTERLESLGDAQSGANELLQHPDDSDNLWFDGTESNMIRAVLKALDSKDFTNRVEALLAPTPVIAGTLAECGEGARIETTIARAAQPASDAQTQTGEASKPPAQDRGSG